MSDAAHARDPIYVRAVVEAAAWRTQLADRGLQSSAGFEVWLAADPLHEQAWNEIQETSEFIDEMATSPEMIGARREALARAHRQNRGRWSGRARGMGVAAALALAAALGTGAGGYLWWRAQPQTYQTALGERRVIPLSDGSKISLDSGSRVSVRYSHDARRLELFSGQARFDVAHSTARPFTVTARDRTVIATGTAFNVDMAGPRVLVTLIEGRVVVVTALAASTPAKVQALVARPQGAEVLRAGEQLAVSDDEPAAVSRVRLDRATAWEAGQLVFDNEPIGDVAARVSRYTERPITVDPAAADLRVSGVFEAGDARTFIDAVTSYLPLSAAARPDGATLLRRRG